LKKMLLIHNKSSHILPKTLATLTKLLRNKELLWVGYHALMGCRLCVMGMQPGVLPLRMGIVWQCAIVKCALKSSAENAKAACASM
jgi:hypothetical protein